MRQRSASIKVMEASERQQHSHHDTIPLHEHHQHWRRSWRRRLNDDDDNLSVSLDPSVAQIVARHSRQSSREFLMKMAIGCVILVGLAAWLALTFWRDKRRRAARARARRQRQPLRRLRSDSSSGTIGSVVSIGSAGGGVYAYQRDARAVGHEDNIPEEDLDQNQLPANEFFNPMWTSGRPHGDPAAGDVIESGGGKRKGECIRRTPPPSATMCAPGQLKLAVLIIILLARKFSF